MAEQVQGGRLAAQAIAAEGVDTIFTLCGGHVMPIYEGCRLEGIRVVDVRHEQAAGARGRGVGPHPPQRAASPSSPPGRASPAWSPPSRTASPRRRRSSSSAAPGRSSRPSGRAAGARPARAILAPITKWAAVCTQPSASPSTWRPRSGTRSRSRAGRSTSSCRWTCCSRRRRPSGTVRQRTLGRARVRRSARADEGGRPLDQGRAAGGGRRQRDLVGRSAGSSCAPSRENGQLPVFLNGSGRGALPPDHPLLFQHARGTRARGGRRRLRRSARRSTSASASAASARTEARPRPRATRGARPQPRARRRDRRATRRPCSAILADGVRTGGSDRAAWLAAAAARRRTTWWDEHRPEIESDAAPLHHYRLAAELDRVLDPDTIVIGDGGDVVAAVSRVLRVHRPGHWLDPGPFGCLGVGPPLRARRQGAPGRTTQVVVIAGDGAFGLNGFEFDTLVRFGAAGRVRHRERRRPGARSASRSSASTATRARSRRARADALRPPHGGARRPRRARRAPGRARARARARARGRRPAIVNVMLDPDAMAGHAYRGM